MMAFKITRIIAIIVLFGAIGSHPYSYYTLLRFIVCGVSAYGTYKSVIVKNISWAWIFGIIAVLFNPILPIHLNREIWIIIDIGVAVVLLLSIFLYKAPKSEMGSSVNTRD